MKMFKKISAFISIVLALSLLFSVCAFADNKDLNADRSLSFNERLEYAVQGTVTGMLMVFAVLTLLTLILYISKVFFYDIPKKKSEKRKKEPLQGFESAAIEPQPTAIEPEARAESDDGELAAVITAAVAAMLQSEEYENEFKSGFRVVSFKRNDNASAWNKK